MDVAGEAQAEASASVVGSSASTVNAAGTISGIQETAGQPTSPPVSCGIIAQGVSRISEKVNNPLASNDGQLVATVLPWIRRRSRKVCSSGRDGKDEDGSSVEMTSTGTGRKKPLTLMTLPQELQMMLLRFMDWPDIERLRRTCRYFHGFATPPLVRTLFGRAHLQMMLLSHCRVCLRHDMRRAHLLLPLPGTDDPGYPLASRCIDCAISSGDGSIRVGQRVGLANFHSVWVCRVCGYPITDGRVAQHTLVEASQSQFHRGCHRSYSRILVFFFLLGWIQFSIGVVAAALAWRYFRGEVLVFAPSVVSRDAPISRASQPLTSSP
jgi:hypothetical protein